MKKIELNRIENVECHKKCSKDKRKEITIDDLCLDTSSAIDGLPIRCVGEWAEQKVFHLIQYFGIFTNGMHKKWSGLNYIEICSGPGRCINRSTGEEFDGTALAIAKHENIKYLDKVYFFDFNKDVITHLNNRLKNIGCAEAFFGDYNDKYSICRILKKNISKNHLNIVFIDPTDCSLPFSLIKEIEKTLNNVDFIINIASGTDFNRNIANLIKNPSSYIKTYNKYVDFLGADSFFMDANVKQIAEVGDNIQLRRLFRESYEKSLKKIGYSFFAYKPIKHYYDLIFAAKNERGLDFWEKANAITFDGQREMLF